MTMRPESFLFETRGISKRFGPTVANDRIDFNLRPGEIHALLGENGAGKSTLLSILCGLYQPDSGAILVDSEEVKLASPIDAIHHGIGTVHQHFALAGTLTVLENIALGTVRGVRLDLDQVRRQAAPALDAFGLTDQVDERVNDLSLGQRQRLEIVHVLARGSRMLLLDEPTSILTPAETGDLFAALRQLTATGVGVVIVTHKLDEALAISDRVTVLRRGRVTGSFIRSDFEDLSAEEATSKIVACMFDGAPLADLRSEAPSASRATMLRLEHVTVRGDRGVDAATDIILDLHRGEVLGIAGVDGNGQRELAEAIAGQREIASGHIFLHDTDLTRLTIVERQHAGIGYLTDDRLGEGCASGLSLTDNLMLKSVGRPPFSKGFFINRKAMDAEAKQLIAEFDIRTPGPGTPIGQLSGGNIQKALLARELALRPDVLIANKPSHGLDINTADRVLDRLRAHADAGHAVLLIESDLDDLLAVCDRIGVMANGRLVAVLNRDEADADTLGRLMVSAA